MDNPFSVTKIAAGDGFVGRRSKLAEYREKLFISRCGSISICGLPRVGKSSLVYNLLHGEEDMAEKKIIFASLDNIGRCQSFYHMWRQIVRALRSQLDGSGLLDGKLTAALEDVAAAGDDYEEISSTLEDLFKMLGSRGIHTILYLDEFDYVSKVFHRTEQEDPVCYFQTLRELETNPDYKISFIIVSRRSLSFLEARCQGGSAFHLTFDNQKLIGFSKEETLEFRQSVEKYGVQLTDEEWSALMEYTGCSPYLLSMVANDLVALQGRHSFAQILDDCAPRFDAYFKELVNLLEDEGYLQRMIQIFVGPKYDLNAAHVRELESRGYITSVGETLSTISPAFEQYLKEIVFLNGNNKIWPLLTKAEQHLRAIVRTRLSRKFGPAWDHKIEDEYLSRIKADSKRYSYFVDFEKARKFIVSTKKKYGAAVSVDLLNVISVQEIAQILKQYWSDFADIFGKEPYTAWKPKLEMMSFARDPLAHANPQYLTPVQVSETNAYCEAVLALKLS